MKKVLLVSQYFDPESFKGNDVAIELQKRGYKVDVLTASQTIPKVCFLKGMVYSRNALKKEMLA